MVKKPSGLKMLVSDILLVERIQMRASIMMDWIDEMALDLQAEPEQDESPLELPAVILFEDGQGGRWCPDGEHRIIAYQQAGREWIPVRRFTGAYDDAFDYALAANKGHGKRRNSADIDNVLKKIFESERWKNRSTVDIQRHTGIDQSIVSRRRQAVTYASISDDGDAATSGAGSGSGITEYTDKHGHKNVMNNTHIGKGDELRIQIAACIRDHPDWSNNKIKEELKCSGHTVAKVKAILADDPDAYPAPTPQPEPEPEPEEDPVIVAEARRTDDPLETLGDPEYDEEAYPSAYDHLPMPDARPEPEPSTSGAGSGPVKRPEPEPMKDEAGSIVPDHLVSVFKAEGKFKEAIDAINKARRVVEALAADPAGRYLHWGQFSTDLDNAKGHVSCNRPFAVCPWCHGNGCGRCRQSGFVTKQIHDNHKKTS